MKKQKLPRGWTHKKIRELIDYYDHQNEDEQVAEYEAVFGNQTETMISVPTELVPAILKLIARHEKIA